MQGDKLLHLAQQKEDQRKIGDKQILRSLQKAHAA